MYIRIRFVYTFDKEREDGGVKVRLVVITGMSGAGKTEAMRAFEDMGYFCIDNLPPALIPKFAELCAQTEGAVDRVVLVSDVRGGHFFDALFDSLQTLDQMGVHYEIVFLEASDEILVRRFKESRRRHPLPSEGGLLEAIQQERKRLAGLRGMAHHLIDTSAMTLGDLRARIQRLYGDVEQRRLGVHIVSFGFKHGIPIDVDLLFDVRFLPNPHYVDDLRDYDGTCPEVAEYVFRGATAQRLITHLKELLEFLLPQYEREGKGEVVVGIGCTGGRHRSVAVAERLLTLVNGLGYQGRVNHRDIHHSPLPTGLGIQ